MPVVDIEDRIGAVRPAALTAERLDVLQVNVGLRCNMACTHCHQCCGPGRTEQMSPETMAATVEVARRAQPALVDVTGGAPELYPRIRELVGALRADGHAVQLRTNLTALDEPGCADLPALWARHGVRLLASLPSPDAATTDGQRGERTFARCIVVLRRLNALGFGTTEALRLDLAANPTGAALPASGPERETVFREQLASREGVRFHELRTLTNMPLGRFRRALERSGELTAYLTKLEAAFNPATLRRLACRSTLAVGWDGRLFDCDFNLAADLPVCGDRRTVDEYDDSVLTRPLALGTHCYACTAQAGSS